MHVKIILDDEREFEVGQEVEWMDVYGDKKEWVKCEVCNERLALIARAPDRYRAIAPKVKRPMTAWDEKTKYRHNICPFCGIVGMERNGYSEYYAFDCGTTIYAGYMQSCDKNTITQAPACKRIAELQEQLEKARRGATRATRESASTS